MQIKATVGVAPSPNLMVSYQVRLIERRTHSFVFFFVPGHQRSWRGLAGPTVSRSEFRAMCRMEVGG